MLEYTPFVLPFIISTGILAYLCIYSFRLRKQIEIARGFSLLTFTMTIWTICYALELVSTTLDGKIFWAMMKYLGSAPGPVVWFVFSLYYTNHQKWFTPAVRWLLGDLRLCNHRCGIYQHTPSLVLDGYNNVGWLS